jgi:hypothetical protein
MISRRALLRGAIGGSVLSLGLPLLEPMLNSHGTALAAGTGLPKRYGFFFWGHGLPLNYRHNAVGAQNGNQFIDVKTQRPDLWTPAKTGKDWDITEYLKPLARHQQNINVVTGTEIKTATTSAPPDQANGHHRGSVVALTADRPSLDNYDTGVGRALMNRPSLDQFIAHHQQFYTDGEPSFRSLEIGMSEKFFIYHYGFWVAVSFNGPDLINYPVRDPQKFFDYVFAVPPDTSELVRETSLLDVVADDTRLLMAKLGTRDKQRLDQHLTHINDIERRLKVGRGTCSVPTAPAGNFTGETQNMAKLDALGDILVAALRCDLTRVFSVQFTPSGGLMRMNEAGEVDGPGALEVHESTHFQGGDDVHYNVTVAATRYHMTAFATFLDKLANDTDVNGQNLLDSSCIFGTSEMGEGCHHGTIEMPIVMAGKAGGALDTGWHIRDEKGNYCRAHYTALRAMGLDVPTYGFNGAETSSAFEFLKA